MNQESINERMRKRGEERFQDFIRDSGGVYSIQELTKLLDKSRVEIIAMACARQLIGFKVEGDWVFPVAQFNDGELTCGVREVLSAFREGIDDVSVVLFFLSNYENTGLTPISLLKQGFSLEILIQSASTWYDHAAR